MSIRKSSLIISIFIASTLSTLAQLPNVILGRPTDHAITLSVMNDKTMDFYIVYGNSMGNYNLHTDTVSIAANTPLEKDLNNLSVNTRYYYQIKYKLQGSSSFASTPEYNFHTQRAPGSKFSFTLEADEHLYDIKGVKSMYQVTLNNQALDTPDFMMSLGDIFGDDHNPYTITSADLDQLHKDYRPFLGSISHSIPFYVCLGNHEGENDFYLNHTPPNNLAIWATLWRKYYYPNPYPNNFYSGNTDNEPYGVGNPENYYAWNWGDALFVVLDVYRDECDTSAKPLNWNWTLGRPQYNWLRSTLEGSQAKYKFVFAHHLRGQGRGAINEAPYFEWGGYQGANGNYTFDTYRPGWGKPIHQLFKENQVTAFFQGHDHLFALEEMDSILYVETPMAADSTYQIGVLANASAYTSNVIDGTGHIKVTVSSTCVRIDYIKAYLPADTMDGLHHNRTIAFTKIIGECSDEVIPPPPNTNFVTVYPNPANDIIHVKFNDNSLNHSIQLYNSEGKLIRRNASENINTQKLPSGMYLLDISSEKNHTIKKIIVTHP